MTNLRLIPLTIILSLSVLFLACEKQDFIKPITADSQNFRVVDVDEVPHYRSRLLDNSKISIPDPSNLLNNASYLIDEDSTTSAYNHTSFNVRPFVFPLIEIPQGAFIDEVRLYFNANSSPTDYTIELSVDGLNWDFSKDYLNTLNENRWIHHKIPFTRGQTHKYRYYRVTANDFDFGYVFIRELQFREWFEFPC